MNFTKSEEQLIQEIKMRARSTIQMQMSSLNSSPMGSVSFMIQEAITEAIGEAFRTMMQNTYTDAQFEKDMNLRS